MPKFFPGWVKPLPDSRDVLYAVSPVVLEALPPSVDLSAKLPPSNNQLQLGSCGPHALDQIINFNQNAQGMPYLETSKLFTYYNTRVLMGTVNQDSGVDNRTMLKAVVANGVCVPESVWPYNIAQYRTKPPAAAYAASKKIVSYASVAQTLAQMKGILASGFPFLFGFSVFPAIESQQVAQTGDLPMPSGASIGGHDVCVCGYSDATQRFKFQNSWGTDWGNSGYGTIPYAYATSSNWAGDFWVINAIEGPPVVQAPVITSSSTASGTVGSPFNYNIAATNTPTSYLATGLPPGLGVNQSTGVIDGIPGQAGTYNASISATNAGGTGSALLAISIAPGTTPVPNKLDTVGGFDSNGNRLWTAKIV